MSSFNILKQNSLSLKLVPMSIRELFFIETAPCDFYGNPDGLFQIIVKKDRPINKLVLKDLIENQQYLVFTYPEERALLKEHLQKELVAVIRSLSIGDPVEKGRKALNYMTINLGHLYEDPTNDTILELQYKSARNLSAFLMENTKIHEELLFEFKKQHHHYILAQPMISSLFVLGVLKASSQFNDKETEQLFLTSYFKDIGMSAIPSEKFEKDNLTTKEKELLAKHPTNSVNILEGRVGLNSHHYKIIECHHAFGLLNKDLEKELHGIEGEDDEVITGVETVILSTMDIISAMIAKRPYREATSLLEALEFTKKLIGPQYPQEFKLVVNYFKNFFSDFK